MRRLDTEYREVGSKVGADELVANCTKHCHALRRLYANLANRGEATKETVQNVVERGVYVIGASPL
eukprot:COSAG06_NODE_21676_length_749_cov_0.923077_2_plen_66_part_00